MNKIASLFAIGLIVLAVCTPVQAALFDLSYSDSSGNVASGQLTAIPNGNGSYTAISGSFLWTSGSYLGNYTLLPNPDAPGVTTAHGQHYPDGTDLIYDNQLFPTSNPVLNGNGLVFESIAYALNLWGNGPDNYTLFLVGHDHPQYGPQYNGGVFSITAVPEPSTYIAGLLMLTPLVAQGVRFLRQSKTTS
jgi:hypothetical protein